MFVLNAWSFKYVCCRPRSYTCLYTHTSISETNTHFLVFACTFVQKHPTYWFQNRGEHFVGQHYSSRRANNFKTTSRTCSKKKSCKISNKILKNFKNFKILKKITKLLENITKITNNLGKYHKKSQKPLKKS